MSEKEDLKAKAEELGLDTSGTSAELKERIVAHEASATPEVSEDTQPAKSVGSAGEGEALPKIPKIGAFVQTEAFNLSVSEHGGGAPLLNVSRVGWVGPAQLVTHAGLLDDLIDGLQKLREQD